MGTHGEIRALCEPLVLTLSARERNSAHARGSGGPASPLGLQPTPVTSESPMKRMFFLDDRGGGETAAQSAQPSLAAVVAAEVAAVAAVVAVAVAEEGAAAGVRAVPVMHLTPLPRCSAASRKKAATP